MAQFLDRNRTDALVVDWLKFIAKAAALGQISDTEPEPATALGLQEATT